MSQALHREPGSAAGRSTYRFVALASAAREPALCGVMSEGDQEAILVRDRVSAGIGLRRFIGRLIIERHRARFESPSAGAMTFTGPVQVTRGWLWPLGMNTDLVLGHDRASGNEEVVLAMGWRSAPKSSERFSPQAFRFNYDASCSNPLRGADR